MLRKLATTAAAVLAVAPFVASAQGVRVTGVTYAQSIELRPLVYDSVGSYFTTGTGEWRVLADGTPAHCVSGSDYCVFQRSGDRMTMAPLTQDLSFVSWGLGEGISVHADVRARAQLSSHDLVYPGSDRSLELIDAYADIDRSWGRARIGRQWVSGGLGVYDFDGLSGVYRHDRYSIEAWAGRALVQGINNTYASAQLASAEDLPPDQDGYIVGARGRFRPNAVTSVTATYQRVLMADHSGLYSERAALDASTRALGASIDLALAYDMVTGAWNEARLRVGRAGFHQFGYSIEARHSAPFFETWTIWGAFSPVGFDEGRATVDWRSPSLPLTLSAHGAYRKYNDADAGMTLRTDGWRAGADAIVQGPGALSAMASYDVDIGNGASRNDARASVRWSGQGERSFGLTGSAVQNIYEFNVGTGRIIGGAFDVTWPLGPDLHAMADIGVYRQLFSVGAPGPDWTQRRASLRLEWTLGRDPGLAGTAK